MTCCGKATPRRDSSVTLSGMPAGRNRDRRSRSIPHSCRRRIMPTRGLEAIFERLAVGEVWCELVVVHAQGRADRHVHVEVLVCPEAPAEEDIGLALRQLAVRQQAFAVLRGVDGVIRLVSVLGETAELAHDDGLVGGVV